ncbi:DUF6292 family protein [Actinoplanes palleronii]|uniref:DUF6292 family protein n=1 Tax=Actinoplanes palleronii TaxID=113570 RepID=UPI001943E3E7|nr:DUF6292 family protein [Actinoplanes palleronii]
MRPAEVAGHWGYLRAVAEALEAAGLPVADWRADPGVPRDGWIPFDRGRPSVVTWEHDQAGLSWSEVDGWSLLLINTPGRRTAVRLPVPLVAAPFSLVQAVAAQAGHFLQPGDSPTSMDFDGPPGTPEFEHALSRYA